MRRIASRDNPHFKALKKLALSARERRSKRHVLLDGLHLVETCQRFCGSAEEVLVSDSGLQRVEIADYLADPAVAMTVTCMSDRLFADLALVDTPSGIMAVVSPPLPTRAPEASADSVLLDGVQDPGNVGSIFRSAAAAGFRQVLLSPDCAQTWSPKTLRSAMGAHFQLDIHEACDLAGFLQTFAGQTVATLPDAAIELFDISLSGPVAWVFGSEGLGVRPAVLAATRLGLAIPMPGASDSLNVAAAAAICLFETVRQRRTAVPPDPGSGGR